MNLSITAWTRAHELYHRITEHYGAGPYYVISPELVVFHDTEDGYGYWSPETIWLNFAACTDWHDVVGTLIHEFCHHHQDPERMDTKVYETEANAVAARDAWLFLEGE